MILSIFDPEMSAATCCIASFIVDHNPGCMGLGRVPESIHAYPMCSLFNLGINSF